MNNHNQVLVVDDEDGPRESLKIILKAEFGVTATESGSLALELLRRTEVDVVLLDLTMPEDLSGTQTLEAIRSSGIDVEVVVITGQGALDTAVECLRLGARDYIAKPYRAEDVRAAVRSALAARTARKRASEMRGHLLENLSHEFRTPLHAITGYTEILSDEASETLSSEQLRALARIQLNSERLLSYIEGLFFLAELDAGETPANAREFAVRPWLEQLISPIRRDADQNGVIIEIVCDNALTGYAHPETLARLISALTYAAADQPSGGTIRVVAQRTHEAFHLSIDPGRGVAGVSVGTRSSEISDLNLSDPLAQEVIVRAAASLNANIATELDGGSILRIHLEIPIQPAATTRPRTPTPHHSGVAQQAR
ncbi:MAG: response regulator [Candidatus Binatia bacterium]|nr:response regulator [Candidatus Binatia bacterium]